MLHYLCVCAILGFLLSQSPASAKESSRRPADLLPNGKEVRNAASIDFAAILPKANACWVLASVDHAADSGRFVVRSSAIDGATGKKINTIGYDIRVVRDTIAIDFGQISKEQNWILAEIIAEPIYATTVGGYINGATGELVRPPGSHFAIIVSGRFKVITILAGDNLKNPTTYEWELPGGMRSQDPENRLYSPFRSGGIAVLRINYGLEGSAKFRPMYVIPVEWKDFVLPAWKFQQEHSDLFDVNLVAQNREQLEELLANKNPFLAIAACRTLTETRILGNDFIAGAFAKSSGLRQAVFTYLLLKNGPQPLGEAAVEEIGKIVDTADNADTLKGIALGALTALREPDHHTGLLGFQLLEKLERKQAVLGAKTEEDK